MPGNFKKDDLRILKTYKYLVNAIAALLERRSFKHITVNDICGEALISRAAFYTHFKDKYDLLSYWLNSLIKPDCSLGDAQNLIVWFVYGNSKAMKNIMYDADNETVGIVHSFLAKVIESIHKASIESKYGSEYIILSNFCTGGVMQMLKWQLDNNYNTELNNTDKKYINDLLTYILSFGVDSSD